MAWRLGLTGQPPTPDVLTIQNRCCQNQNIPRQSRAAEIASNHAHQQNRIQRLQFFPKKSKKNFAILKNRCTFAYPNETDGSLGSLAQLVQSVCLTSRGSGVRLPQLPQKVNFHSWPFSFYSTVRPIRGTFGIIFLGYSTHRVSPWPLLFLTRFSHWPLASVWGLGTGNALLGYATRFLRHSVPERASYGTEYAFGAQNGFLWYATHFLKLSVLKTGFSGTGEIFGTENALLRYGMNRTRLLRSVFWLEDAAITNNPVHPQPHKLTKPRKNSPTP